MSSRRRALVLLLLIAVPAFAGDVVTVAVASNFSITAAELSSRFTAETGIEVRLSSGSTGKLYAQILHGAPFDVFLAADTERPELLEQSGHAVAGSRFTYASGALVLWSRDAKDCLAALADRDAGHVALANPKTAPYGRAAREFLDSEDLWPAVSGRAVYGENIAQTLQFVATGNASLGLIARSQLGAPQLPRPSCTWDVPAATHSQLEQQAALLQRAAGNADARRYLEYLHSAAAMNIVRRHGYEVSP
ncbi:MAG: molybdate ABC transporter substrate-binding protein [Gammaproteobacteria bacterium]|nr:molybdate ABC transporter substrate-binding protein [Gammaproteobacteria bacterium]